jgi:plasmid rolling circle replication initiator protein Rep
MNYSIITKELQALLTEINIKNGKIEKTQDTLAKYYMQKGDPKNADRVKRCSEYVELIHTDTETKITKLNRCMNRLCPTCAAVTARERFFNMFPVIKNLLNDNNFAAHVVFTIPNQETNDISITISQLNKAIYRFCKSVGVKNYTRNLEITYNEQQNTYHIHGHSIFIIEKGTFLSDFALKLDKDSFNNKMTEARLKWTKICNKIGIKGQDTIYRLFIRALDNPKYIIEATKYNCKNWDIPQTAVFDIAAAIENKRLFEVYGQEMKKAYKKQKEITKNLQQAEKYDRYINLPGRYIKAIYYKNTKTHTYSLFDISLIKKEGTLY